MPGELKINRDVRCGVATGWDDGMDYRVRRKALEGVHLRR